jgi:uncharacterized protein
MKVCQGYQGWEGKQLAMGSRQFAKKQFAKVVCGLQTFNLELLNLNFFMQDVPMPDGSMLLEIVTMKMPFGKYKGTVLRNLPVSYLEWFARKGFPKGKLGNLLQSLLEIKMNGLEELLNQIEKLNKQG